MVFLLTGIQAHCGLGHTIVPELLLGEAMAIGSNFSPITITKPGLAPGSGRRSWTRPGPGRGPEGPGRAQALGQPTTQPLCPLSRTRGLLVAVPSARRPNKEDKGPNPSLRHA